MFVSNDVIHDARVVKEARALRGAGHEVRFIAWDRSGRRAERETWDGFEIQYVRTRGFLRFLGSDILRNPLWWRLAVRRAKRVPFDVIHCHDLDTLPIGVRLKRAMGRSLVYDAHEVFAYMIEEDVPRLVSNYALRMEAHLAPRADKIIAANEAIGTYLESVVGRPPTIVRNVQDLVTDGYVPPPDSPFTILYVGTLHKSRFIVPAIEVVGEMPDVRLIVAGGKQLRPAVEALCARHPNTQYAGEVPSDRVLPMTRDSHAVLSMFDPAYRINQVGMPNKIFEAMAAGRPVIVTEGLAMAEIVKREECGLAVPYSREGFRRAVEALRGNPVLAKRLGGNGLEAARREYNWGLEKRRLLAVYDDLAREAKVR